jgi:hypothetical protein
MGRYDHYKITVTGSVLIQAASGETKLRFEIKGELSKRSYACERVTGRAGTKPFVAGELDASAFGCRPNRGVTKLDLFQAGPISKLLTAASSYIFRRPCFRWYPKAASSHRPANPERLLVCEIMSKIRRSFACGTPVCRRQLRTAFRAKQTLSSRESRLNRSKNAPDTHTEPEGSFA